MTAPIKAFIIYAQEDKHVKHELLGFLSVIGEIHNINFWHDEEIKAGQEWEQKIKEQLDDTDLFLMLISIQFFKSDYIRKVELKTAIDRHKANKSIVIPIIVRPCPWDNNFTFSDYTFNLNSLQVLPTGQKPIEEWPIMDAALNDISKNISILLTERSKKEKEKQLRIEEQKKQDELDRQKKDLEKEEDKFWANILERNDLPAFREYLEHYQNGKYRLDATSRIDEINEKEMEAEEQANIEAEKLLWDEAKGKKTIAGYNKYLKSYPEGKYAQYATNRVSELRKQQQEAKQEELEQLELDEWNEAKERKTISAYNKYLKNYPDGKYVNQANKRIEEIRTREEELKQQVNAEKAESAIWEKSKSLNELAGYDNYIQRYPYGKFVDEAKERIAALKVQFTAQSKPLTQPDWKSKPINRANSKSTYNSPNSASKSSYQSKSLNPETNRLYNYAKDPVWWLMLPVIIALSLGAAFIGEWLYYRIVFSIGETYHFGFLNENIVYIVSIIWGFVYSIMGGKNANERKGIFSALFMPFFNIFRPENGRQFLRALIGVPIFNIVYTRLLIYSLAFLTMNFVGQNFILNTGIFLLLHTLAIIYSIRNNDFE